MGPKRSFGGPFPRDVQEAIAWLSANGYTLTSHRGEGTFGAPFVYIGGAKVVVTVDRSQWMLAVASRPTAEAGQYDLLMAAQAGQPYEQVFQELVPGLSGADSLSSCRRA